MEYYCCWRKIYFINEPRFWNILDFSLRKNSVLEYIFQENLPKMEYFMKTFWSKRFVFPVNHWDAAWKTEATPCQLLENRRDAMLAVRKSFGHCHSSVWSFNMAPGRRLTQKDKLKLTEQSMQPGFSQKKALRTKTMTKQSSLTDYVTRKINWFLINPVEWVEISKPPVLE